MGLFSTAKKEPQIGVDFLPDGVAVAQVQAARSGIEWGIHESIVNSSCAASTTFTIARPTLDTFSVEVQCGATTHIEGVTPITTYRLTSIASAGVFGSLDYVQRGIQATVSLDPP